MKEYNRLGEALREFCPGTIALGMAGCRGTWDSSLSAEAKWLPPKRLVRADEARGVAEASLGKQAEFWRKGILR